MLSPFHLIDASLIIIIIYFENRPNPSRLAWVRRLPIWSPSTHSCPLPTRAPNQALPCHLSYILSKSSHSSSYKSHWLPIRQRISFKLCLLVFRCLRGEALPYLTEILSLVSSSDALRSHRSAAPGNLIIPQSFTKTFGPRGFAVSGPTAWNSLQHTWKIKICLLLSDQNSKLTFLAPNLFVFQLCLLTRLYVFGLVHFCPQAMRHSRNGYWSVRERLQMIFRIVSYLTPATSTFLRADDTQSSTLLSAPQIHFSWAQLNPVIMTLACVSNRLIIIIIIMLQMPKPPQSASPHHICHTLYTQKTVRDVWFKSTRFKSLI